jgi:four helix bundle protein
LQNPKRNDLQLPLIQPPGRQAADKWRPIMKDKVKSHKDLRVYNNAMEAALKIFELTKTFPPEEKYSLTDLMRRASWSLCSNIGQAWRKRINQTAFTAKLNDSENFACESQVWVEFARKCGYLKDEVCNELDSAYDQILGQLFKMIKEADKWIIKSERLPE